MTKPSTTPSNPTRAPPSNIAPTTGRTKTSAAAARLRLLRNGSIAPVAAAMLRTRAMMPGLKRRQIGACRTVVEV